jgi:hypothetical protein
MNSITSPTLDVEQADLAEFLTKNSHVIFYADVSRDQTSPMLAAIETLPAGSRVLGITPTTLQHFWRRDKARAHSAPRYVNLMAPKHAVEKSYAIPAQDLLVVTHTMLWADNATARGLIELMQRSHRVWIRASSPVNSDLLGELYSRFVMYHA